MAERKEHWRGKGNYLKYGFDTVANRCNLARGSLADQKSPRPSQTYLGLGIAGRCPADSWARSAPRQGAEAALEQQRARGPAGGVPRRRASLPSTVVAAPKAERHLPASLPWPTSPSCMAPALLGQQQTSGDKAAGKPNTSRRAVSFIQEAFLNKASKYLTVHYSGCALSPRGTPQACWRGVRWNTCLAYSSDQQ